MNDRVEYLGDGLYCKFDGFAFHLMANDHQHPTDTVVLEPDVVLAFQRFVEQVQKGASNER